MALGCSLGPVGSRLGGLIRRAADTGGGTREMRSRPHEDIVVLSGCHCCYGWREGQQQAN